MEITKQETISLGLRSCGLKLLHTQADTCTYIIIAQLCISGVGIFVLYSFFPPLGVLYVIYDQSSPNIKAVHHWIFRKFAFFNWNRSLLC